MVIRRKMVLLMLILENFSHASDACRISDFLILYWQAFTLENTFEPA